MKKTTMTAALCALMVGAVPAMAQGTAGATTAAAMSQDELTFELLEKGESPRRELRYDLSARTEVTEVKDSTDRKMTMNGQPGPGSMLEETVIATVEVRAPEGGLSKLVISGEPKGTAEGWLAKGDTYIATVNGSGHVTKIEAHGGSGSEGDLDSIRSLAVRLPDEAVGVGASWRETRIIRESGIRAEISYTRTITAIRGDVIEIETTGFAALTHTGEPLEGVPPTVTLESLSGEGEITGKATIDLAHLLPRESMESGDIALNIAMSMGGAQAMKIAQTVVGKKTTERIDAAG
ncbi:MAG: hypothetical protein DHS20C14_17050 [Phycisphaeraceae bacterium]|nr:MAG: hypothetical protein DHS20C14_17050 [Phycisphaeraceae bacterium]